MDCDGDYLIPWNAIAQQTQFYKQEIGNQLHFFYSWDDHEDALFASIPIE